MLDQKYRLIAETDGRNARFAAAFDGSEYPSARSWRLSASIVATLPDSAIWNALGLIELPQSNHVTLVDIERP
jgi:hypothetical protein